MAIFTFNCNDHGPFEIYLPKGEKFQKCPSCGKESKRLLKTGSLRVTEKIDNGMMIRSLDRLKDVDEMIIERNAIHDKSLTEDN